MQLGRRFCASSFGGRRFWPAPAPTAAPGDGALDDIPPFLLRTPDPTAAIEDDALVAPAAGV